MKRIRIKNGIYAAQIQALYQHTPVVLTVNVVNSALVAIVLASYMGQTWWLVFLALTIALTAVLAATETAQRWLPGRTPEITDPIMAVLLAAVLWLAERHHRDAAFAISGTERSARAAP